MSHGSSAMPVQQPSSLSRYAAARALTGRRTATLLPAAGFARSGSRRSVPPAARCRSERNSCGRGTAHAWEQQIKLRGWFRGSVHAVRRLTRAGRAVDETRCARGWGCGSPCTPARTEGWASTADRQAGTTTTVESSNELTRVTLPFMRTQQVGCSRRS